MNILFAVFECFKDVFNWLNLLIVVILTKNNVIFGDKTHVP